MNKREDSRDRLPGFKLIISAIYKILDLDFNCLKF